MTTSLPMSYASRSRRTVGFAERVLEFDNYAYPMTCRLEKESDSRTRVCESQSRRGGNYLS